VCRKAHKARPSPSCPDPAVATRSS
jgi:hypothetical protein